MIRKHISIYHHRLTVHRKPRHCLCDLAGRETTMPGANSVVDRYSTHNASFGFYRDSVWFVIWRDTPQEVMSCER
nr:MAG TPA: hypothetical protein [Caudoviricetes sp.]